MGGQEQPKIKIIIYNPRARVFFFVRAADLREVGNLYSPAHFVGGSDASKAAGL